MLHVFLTASVAFDSTRALHFYCSTRALHFYCSTRALHFYCSTRALHFYCSTRALHFYCSTRALPFYCSTRAFFIYAAFANDSFDCVSSTATISTCLSEYTTACICIILQDGKLPCIITCSWDKNI